MASSEERVAKFLKRLLEHRSALEVAQSLSAPFPQHAPRIPGGSSVSLSAINKQNPAKHAKVAGVVAYYPFCYENDDPSVPVLVLVGEKDDWTPAATCQPFAAKPTSR